MSSRWTLLGPPSQPTLKVAFILPWSHTWAQEVIAQVENLCAWGQNSLCSAHQKSCQSIFLEPIKSLCPAFPILWGNSPKFLLFPLFTKGYLSQPWETCPRQSHSGHPGELKSSVGGGSDWRGLETSALATFLGWRRGKSSPWWEQKHKLISQ